jgi:hypothetical protein
VMEGAPDEGTPATEAEQADIEEGDTGEEIDYNTAMPSKPSHLDFGKSTVSEADMAMMTKLGYFREADKGLIHLGGEETIPKPENDEVVVFKSFFKAGLRFPLHRMIADVLENFEIYLHQLTPNAIVRLSVYIWALRSQGLEPLAEAFCRVHELHYQMKAREDGLHENFGCYNFAYRKKTPVVSYRSKWPTGWESEWFYVKIDEKKEKLVQSPLELTFGLTRPQCNMTPGAPCPDVVYEFRVVSEHIGTRDLVQDYLANRVFPTLREWGMPKLEKEKKKKNELVRLPYHFKFKKHFKEPCQEWLDTIEVMCNEILGNYTRKEDQLMTAAFGARPKRRLDRVMDALNYEYPDYERLNKGVEGQKRKIIVSVVGRQAARMVKEDEEILKKRKLSPEPKAVAPKRRKASALKQKATDMEEETPSTPSAADVEEILKVMTASLPIKLSPLGPHLPKLLQKKKEPSAAKKSVGPKKRRIITVTEAIEETPPPPSASKAPDVESATATEAAPSEATITEAATAKDANLESTFPDIDKILLDMAAEEAAAATEETMATVPGKEKDIAKDTSEEENFNFQNLIGQELSMAEKEELRDYAISCGYQSEAMLFGGIDDESLGCLRYRTAAKVVGTLSKSIGFPKLETDISRYRRQHIVGSLFYSNFKVKTFLRLFIVFNDEGVC